MLKLGGAKMSRHFLTGCCSAANFSIFTEQNWCLTSFLFDFHYFQMLNKRVGVSVNRFNYLTSVTCDSVNAEQNGICKFIERLFIGWHKFPCRNISDIHSLFGKLQMITKSRSSHCQIIQNIFKSLD